MEEVVPLKVVIDFDGTLTAEELQVRPLAEKALRTLADDILGVPYSQLVAEYEATQAQMLRAPFRYWWSVNGLVASYCDEGPFILNTATLMQLLSANERYLKIVELAFPVVTYDAIADCTNYLFNRHTAELPPLFRPAAREVLERLMAHPDYHPLVLTNSLGDKVRRYLTTLGIDDRLEILGDTRQYAMDPDWEHRFSHPLLGDIQVWPVVDNYPVDLRRPAYYRALTRPMADGESLVVVADSFSLPGALPLLMGLPFILLRNSYTPAWSLQAVSDHPLGHVIEDLAELPVLLQTLGT